MYEGLLFPGLMLRVSSVPSRLILYQLHAASRCCYLPFQLRRTLEDTFSHLPKVTQPCGRGEGSEWKAGTRVRTTHSFNLLHLLVWVKIFA